MSLTPKRENGLGLSTRKRISSVISFVAEPALAILSLATVVTCAHWNAKHSALPRGDSISSPSAAGASFEPPKDPPASPVEKASKSQPSESVLLSDEIATRLTSWSRALREYHDGKRQDPLRILWFGDSHTAADYWTQAVRQTLASEIPIAGPGYLSLGVTNYRHGMARLWKDGSLEVAPHPPARRVLEGDGVFGLGGTRVTMKDSSAVVSLRLTFEGVSRNLVSYELYYRMMSKIDSLSWTAGTVRRELRKDSPVNKVGEILVAHFEAPGNETLEIRALSGTPQLFGVVAETRTGGVVVDTLGINGARFGTFLAWEKEAFAAVVAARKPLIAVVAYGTNEVFDEDAVSRHAKRLEDVIERLRSAVPDVGCIVAGPTDAGKGGEAVESRVVAMDQAERSTAERLGCVYFSAYDVMAKDGGFSAWRSMDPPLALSDGIHLTARGYARLGEAFARQCLMTKSN